MKFYYSVINGSYYLYKGYKLLGRFSDLSSLHDYYSELTTLKGISARLERR